MSHETELNKEELSKEEQKRQNTILFINAAQEMIDEEGLDKISVRKIAQRAGFHNSTIYLYFKDLDQLTMLASMKYFQEYSRRLEEQSKKNLSPTDNFLAIWGFFFDTIMKNSHIFYNFFFGKRSHDLSKIMNAYYDIFPQERTQLSDTIKTMYFGKNITERSLHLLQPLIKEENSVFEENVSILNELSVSYCKYKLEQKCRNPELDSEEIKNDFLRVVAYITGI